MKRFLKALPLVAVLALAAGCGGSAKGNPIQQPQHTTTTTFRCPDGSPPKTNPAGGPFSKQCDSVEPGPTSNP